jgi:phosphatidylserine decarboxylase
MSYFSNMISRQFGKFANSEFSPNIQTFINQTYINSMKLDMSEFESADRYKTLNHLFTRELRVGRKFDRDNRTIISPCDSEIFEIGEIQVDKAYQIKGMSYKVGELIKENSINSGQYINFYLSPRDYHRYHSPLDMQVLSAKYISGALYPVNKTYLNKTQSLFVKNERVVLEVLSTNGVKFFMVFVGALNVGKIVFNFDSQISTNSNNGDNIYRYNNLFVQKGDELGRFEMGSTIVMIIPNNTSMKFDLSVNQKVKFGDTIGKLL